VASRRSRGKKVSAGFAGGIEVFCARLPKGPCGPRGGLRSAEDASVRPRLIFCCVGFVMRRVDISGSRGGWLEGGCESGRGKEGRAGAGRNGGGGRL